MPRADCSYRGGEGVKGTKFARQTLAFIAGLFLIAQLAGCSKPEEIKAPAGSTYYSGPMASKSERMSKGEGAGATETGTPAPAPSNP